MKEKALATKITDLKFLISAAEDHMFPLKMQIGKFETKKPRTPKPHSRENSPAKAKAG